MRAATGIAALTLALAMAAPARAQSCGATVTGTVTLASDLTCPTGPGLVLASGATLDCAGHILIGGGQAQQYGIYLRDAAGAVVLNCIVTNFEVGIRLKGAAAAIVQDNTVQGNTRYGIEITQGSVSALVQRNAVRGNGDEGIHVSGPDAGDAGHQILDNTVDANATEGIYLLTTDGNTIARNTIRNQGTAGIRLKGARRNTVADNLLTNDFIELFQGAQANVFTHNLIVGEHVKLDGSSQNEFYDTSVQGSGGRPSIAYELIASSDNTFADAAASNPVDDHISATAASVGNAFPRFTASPTLRCAIEDGSSVTVTDASGNRVPCGVGPVDERLAGTKLLIRDRPSNPSRKRLLVLSRDTRITRGGGPGTDDDPVVVGASLRMTTAAGDGFDVTYDLPSSFWSYGGAGYRYADPAGLAGPIAGITVAERTVVKVRGKGALLLHSLGASPDPVDVVLTFGVGGSRFCMHFGGTVSFTAGKTFLAASAPAPATCP